MEAAIFRALFTKLYLFESICSETYHSRRGLLTHNSGSNVSHPPGKMGKIREALESFAEHTRESFRKGLHYGRAKDNVVWHAIVLNSVPLLLPLTHPCIDCLLSTQCPVSMSSTPWPSRSSACCSLCLSFLFFRLFCPV